jgi:ABC-type amino acid transport substrate-binding protein
MLKPLHLLSAVCAAAGLLLAVSAQCAELTGTLKSIQERKAIRIGFARDAYPMSFLGDNGEAQGYSIDLCRARLYRSEEIVRIFDKWFGKLGKPGDVLVLMYALNALPE